MEGLNFLALFVLLFRGKLSGHQQRIGGLLLLWLLLCFIELFNPFAASRGAWFHAIRQVVNNIIPFFIIYSILLYQKKSINYLLGTWVLFTTLAALYTLVQEFGGYPPWDYNYIARDENAMSLINTFGRMRKISFFSGPMENGVVLAFNGVMCLGLAFQRGMKMWHKYGYLVLSMLSAWAMIYTGTRTATVMFVAGAAIYVILSRRRELLLYTAFVTCMLVAYIAVTGGGQALYVMTTAFNPDEDPSMQVRYNNQMRLRTYLVRSPIGYGLGSTGYLGMKYSPHTFLGSFPPDSELVRIVIETGFIGLALWLYINFYAIKRSLDSLKIRVDDFSDNFRMVLVALLFMFLLGQYPQEIMNIGSLKILFALCLAYISLDSSQMKQEVENG
ncbi:O-antigen ligase [Reichenbachiella sp. 5M10]|uniref:O-antigen ligase family protein n=1 Tax=Reichenbachiella sp. 5M10 TaxID=1889772 RepID=UPI001303FE3F|nr:O-antigen ligase family protein [Reichenbachiella sp. 5M10]